MFIEVKGWKAPWLASMLLLKRFGQADSFYALWSKRRYSSAAFD
jgi:hypothetical protein